MLNIFYQFSENRIHNQKIIEGELRCKQLEQHLERTRSPKAVFLSEDASGVVKNVVYDSHSNQLVGLVLPTNDSDGMPKLWTFKAESAELIENYMEQPESTLVYIVVAQPLKKGAPSFILQIYSTDNKFETSSVLKRWVHTEKELKKCVIFY